MMEVSPDRRTVTVSVPLAMRMRGGRKQVVVPEETSAWAPQRAQIDSTLVKAIARAFRWQRMLEGGSFSSVAELAAAERINASYLARVLRLTLLAPDIVEAILDGRHSQELTVARLFRPFPVDWERQQTVRP